MPLVWPTISGESIIQRDKCLFFPRKKEQGVKVSKRILSSHNRRHYFHIRHCIIHNTNNEGRGKCSPQNTFYLSQSKGKWMPQLMPSSWTPFEGLSWRPIGPDCKTNKTESNHQIPQKASFCHYHLFFCHLSQIKTTISQITRCFFCLVRIYLVLIVISLLLSGFLLTTITPLALVVSPPNWRRKIEPVKVQLK